MDDRFVQIIVNYFKLNLMLFSFILLVAPVESPKCFAFGSLPQNFGRGKQHTNGLIYLFTYFLRVAYYNFESLTAIGMLVGYEKVVTP